MSRLDDRLRRASASVRHAAESAVPEPVAEEASNMWKRPVLAFAGALVGVIVVVGAVALLRDAPADPVTGPTTAPLETTTTAAVETTSPADVSTTTHGPPVSSCTAGELPVPPAQDGLPEAVAAMRDAIVTAAIACDADALVELGGPDLVTSFGGGGPEVFAGDEGDELMVTLVQVLATPHAQRDHGGGGEDYVWPSAFAYGSWDEIPEADLEPLRGFMTDEELDQMALFGAYAYWRVGITADGDWTFFVAGD